MSNQNASQNSATLFDQTTIFRRRFNSRSRDILKNLTHQLPRQRRTFRIPITPHLLSDRIGLESNKIKTQNLTRQGRQHDNEFLSPLPDI